VSPPHAGISDLLLNNRKYVMLQDDKYIVLHVYKFIVMYYHKSIVLFGHVTGPWRAPHRAATLRRLKR